MSTEPNKKPEVVVEPDAVGPLGVVAGRGTGRDLRASLLAAFRDAIADARSAGSEASIDDAVHECRKALRRARATVRLVACALGRDDGRDLRRTLREARRLLSPARDVAVLPGALAALSLDEAVRKDIVAVVETGRASAGPIEETRKLVIEAAARVAPLADLMAAALPAELDWDDLADGLADTYKDARRALRKSRRSRVAFHALKRRTKELSAQLELLAGGVEGRVSALRKQVSDLGDELGDVVDELMLRDFVEHHAAARPPEEASALLAALDGQLDDAVRTGRKAAKQILDRRTRRFVRKVGKAIRRDHTPAEPAAPAN